MPGPFNHLSQSLLRLLVWGGFCIVIYLLLYKTVLRKAAESVDDCLNQAANQERYVTRVLAVEGYARCVAMNEKHGKSPINGNPRCPYAGMWSSQRGGIEYALLTLNADGTFVAKPGRGAWPGEPVTGAWTVANGKMIWVYDSGPVWPTDINPIFDEDASALKLREVNGQISQLLRLPTDDALKC